MPDRRSRSSSRSSSSSSSSKRSRSRDRERNQRWRPKRRSKSREKDFKSRICIHWQRGHCSKGEDCRFAHGAHELSSVQGGTWKTVLCKHFEQGTCRRGANCSFAHGEKELRDTYKTILCKYYELGTCKSGDKCNFAHGKEELVKLELPKIEKVEPRIEVKAEKFMEPLNQPEPEKDEAEKAQKAERAEKRTPKKQVPCRYWQNGYCNRAESCPFSHEGPQNERPKEAVPVFKTVLCKYFEQGHCTRGDSCTYAHGIEELQTREAGTYKTVLCKFFEAGTCTKGASCTFAHGGTDLLMDQPATVPPGAPCATAATAWTGTSLADAIAQSAVDSQEPAGPVGVLIQPTRQLSKRQLETIQPVERKQVEMRLIHHEVRPQVEVITVKRCAFFAVGRCKKGEECSYSHQDGPPTVTLVKPRAQPVHVPPRIHVPPAWPEEAEHAEQVDLGSAPNGFPWKTRLCKFFQMGHCNKGASCSYAHGPDEFSGDFVQAANEDVEMELEDVPLPAHFKTQLCKFFTETGQCRKGNACDYAHGTEELRPPQDRPPPVVVPPLAPEERAALAEKEAAEAWKETRGAETVDVDEWDTGWKDSYWKTRPCRFFELGTCNKGAACAFAHGLPISISSGGTIFANAPIKVKDEVHFE